MQTTQAGQATQIAQIACQSGPQTASTPIPTAPQKTFAIDAAGLDLRYPCRDGETLLAGMERAGRRGIPAGCRGGGCGVCRVRVLAGAYRAGKMSVDAVSAAQREAGIVLACRVWPQSDMTLAPESRLQHCVARSVKRAPPPGAMDASALPDTPGDGYNDDTRNNHAAPTPRLALERVEPENLAARANAVSRPRPEPSHPPLMQRTNRPARPAHFSTDGFWALAQNLNP